MFEFVIKMQHEYIINDKNYTQLIESLFRNEKDKVKKYEGDEYKNIVRTIMKEDIEKIIPKLYEISSIRKRLYGNRNLNISEDDVIMTLLDGSDDMRDKIIAFNIPQRIRNIFYLIIHDLLPGSGEQLQNMVLKQDIEYPEAKMIYYRDMIDDKTLDFLVDMIINKIVLNLNDESDFITQDLFQYNVSNSDWDGIDEIIKKNNERKKIKFNDKLADFIDSFLFTIASNFLSIIFHYEDKYGKFDEDKFSRIIPLLFPKSQLLDDVEDELRKVDYDDEDLFLKKNIEYMMKRYRMNSKKLKVIISKLLEYLSNYMSDSFQNHYDENDLNETVLKAMDNDEDLRNLIEFYDFAHTFNE